MKITGDIWKRVPNLSESVGAINHDDGILVFKEGVSDETKTAIMSAVELAPEHVDTPDARAEDGPVAKLVTFLKANPDVLALLK